MHSRVSPSHSSPACLASSQETELESFETLVATLVMTKALTVWGPGGQWSERHEHPVLSVSGDLGLYKPTKGIPTPPGFSRRCLVSGGGHSTAGHSALCEALRRHSMS